MANKKALFLCVELSDYFHNCIVTFAETFDIVCHVVSLSESPFTFPNHPLINSCQKSTFNRATFFKTYLSLNPIVVFTSGWIDSDYLEISNRFRKENIPVLLGLDNHWQNSWKQKIGIAIKKKTILSAASHIWIPGIPQYEFALKLGFPPKNIITGLYAANLHHFQKGYNPDIVHRNILFVGRLVSYKRPVELLQLFKELNSNNDWTLTIIGSGNCRSQLKETSNIKIHDFVQPEELIAYAKKASVFCLPSIREHWGVAVHEFCAAGKLLLLSDQVGVASEFLVHGYNGFKFKSDDLSDFRYYLEKTMTMQDDLIKEFQKRSFQIAQKSTPQEWAYKLHRVITDSKV